MTDTAPTPTDEELAGVVAPGGAPVEAPEDSGYVDYFGVDVEEKFMLPDGRSWLLLKKLDEGARRKYLNDTNKDVRINRQTQDMSMKMGVGDDRFHLLKRTIVGWNLHRSDGKGGMVPVPFNSGSNGAMLEQFLEKADPTLIDKIEVKVRQMNPWLMQDLTVEQIDEQIKELEEMKVVIREREEGKDG